MSRRGSPRTAAWTLDESCKKPIKAPGAPHRIALGLVSSARRVSPLSISSFERLSMLLSALPRYTLLGLAVLAMPSWAQGHRGSFRWPAEAPVKAGVQVSEGEHFVLRQQFEGALCASRALGAVDATWSHSMDFLGTPEHTFGGLLEVHLYDSKERYLLVDEWLTGGNFKFNESFSHWNSLSAHVVMAPPLKACVARRIGLTSQTLEVLVHEAAHLATYTVIPSYRYHPTWFSEGLAMGVERETLRELGLLDDPAQHPRYATQQLVAQRLVQAQRVPGMRAILLDKLGDLNFHERYALWNELMTVLRRKPDEFMAVVNELRATRGGPQMRERMADVVLERYGEAELMGELLAELKDAPADWDETARSLETMGADWEQVAFESVDACAWNLVPHDGHYFIRGSFELLDASTRMRVLLARRADNLIYVELSSEHVALVSAGPSGSHALVRAQLPKIEAGVAMPFEIELGGDGLGVRVGAEERLAIEFEVQDFSGPWGLGVERGGAGIWHAVQVAGK